MKTWRFFAALPLLVVVLRAASPAVNEAVLPEGIFPELDAILRQAVQQSPTMLNRALDLEIAESTRIQARAAMLPSISAYVNIQKSRDKQEYAYTSGSRSNNAYNLTKTPFSASLSQPLFHWGALHNAAQVGEIQASIAKGAYRDGYRLLTQTLRSDYMRLIVLKTSVKRALFFLEFSQNQLALEEARLAKKVISEKQIYPVRIQAEQAQITSERAAFDYEMAKISFARLSGAPVLSDDAIPNALPVIPHVGAVFDQLLAGYLAQKEPPNTEAYTARKQLDIENLNYATYRTRLRPKVNAIMGFSRDQQNNLYGTINSYATTSLYAGISVNWTIFDGYYAGAIVRTSLARRRQMETDYKILTERLGQQAQTQAKQLNFAARTMSISDRALVSAEGSVKYQQEEFARGNVSEADVSLARIYLFDAQLGAYSTRIDYLSRVGDFLGTVVQDPVLANVSDK